MPYTDAAYVGTGQTNYSNEWHVYADEAVPDTDPETAMTTKPLCGERLIGTGHLTPIKRHAREEFFQTMRPRSIAQWLAHPSVCDVCRHEAFAYFNLPEGAVNQHMADEQREESP